jgi:SAM-dependent methyltransferase
MMFRRTESSNGEFVDYCYRTILRREADPEGRAAFVKGLGNRSLDRAGVMKAFLESDEYRLASRENAQLKGYLQQLIFGDVSLLTEQTLPDGIADDGIPYPAGVLRYLVAGTERLGWFVEAGQLGARTVVDLLARNGIPPERRRRVLDFGCGCGRVLRHLRGEPSIELFGTDCNLPAIAWCRRHLGFASFEVNQLAPPLAYGPGSFDLVYAFSVFTHLTEGLQQPWMDEMRRVLAPGGHLIVSVHGDVFLEKNPGTLAGADLETYRRGGLVVKVGDLVGSNYCNAFHPERYLRERLAADFDVVDFLPGGARGNPPQDAYLLRKK